MKRTDPLNSRQQQVLQWISEGCPDGVMAGDGHKTSAKALHHRLLVRVSRKDGRWHASLTSEGEYYLKHGRHPHVSAAAPKTVRQVRATIAKVDTTRAPETEQVQRAAKKRSAYQGKTEELIAQLLAAGGEIHVDEDDNRNIPGLVTYANRRDKVPPGCGWSSAAPRAATTSDSNSSRTGSPPRSHPSRSRTLYVDHIR